MCIISKVIDITGKKGKEKNNMKLYWGEKVSIFRCYDLDVFLLNYVSIMLERMLCHLKIERVWVFFFPFKPD